MAQNRRKMIAPKPVGTTREAARDKKSLLRLPRSASRAKAPTITTRRPQLTVSRNKRTLVAKRGRRRGAPVVDPKTVTVTRDEAAAIATDVVAHPVMKTRNDMSASARKLSRGAWKRPSVRLRKPNATIAPSWSLAFTFNPTRKKSTSFLRRRRSAKFATFASFATTEASRKVGLPNLQPLLLSQQE